MKWSRVHFWLDQWETLPPPLQADLTHKTVMVTGGNTGIGFETAKIFAGMHPKKLILGCRSEERGNAAIASTSSCTAFYSVTKLDMW